MNSTNLHQAIYTRLAGYTALTSKVVGIYSQVPQPDDAQLDSAFPYVTFGIPSAQPFDTKTHDGLNAVIQVHIWTRTNSDLVRRAINDAVYDALHKYDLVVSSAATVALGFETYSELMDPDGETMHGVLSFRVLIDEI